MIKECAPIELVHGWVGAMAMLFVAELIAGCGNLGDVFRTQPNRYEHSIMP